MHKQSTVEYTNNPVNKSQIYKHTDTNKNTRIVNEQNEQLKTHKILLWEN